MWRVSGESRRDEQVGRVPAHGVGVVRGYGFQVLKMAQIVTVREQAGEGANPNYRFVGGDYDFVTRMDSAEDAQNYAESLGSDVRVYDYGRFVPLEYAVDETVLMSVNPSLPSLRVPGWVVWAEKGNQVRLTKDYKNHYDWFKKLGWPRSGSEFDHITRGAAVFNKKDKIVRLYTWGTDMGKSASNEVVRTIIRKYPRTSGWGLEEYDYGQFVSGGERVNPFMESLVQGMGTGAGMAMAAGVLAPLIVDRVSGIARKAGLIKGKGNPKRLTDRFMNEHIHMPGFPQLVVTRGFAYQHLRGTGYPEGYVQAVVYSMAKVVREPLTHADDRDEWLRSAAILQSGEVEGKANPGIKLGLYGEEKLWDVYELGLLGSEANRSTSTQYRAESWADLAINAGEWFIESGRYRADRGITYKAAFDKWWGLLRVKPGRGMTKAVLQRHFTRGMEDARRKAYPYGVKPNPGRRFSIDYANYAKTGKFLFTITSHSQRKRVMRFIPSGEVEFISPVSLGSKTLVFRAKDTPSNRLEVEMGGGKIKGERKT